MFWEGGGGVVLINNFSAGGGRWGGVMAINNSSSGGGLGLIMHGRTVISNSILRLMLILMIMIN